MGSPFLFMELKIIQSEEVLQEKLSLRSAKPKTKPVDYKVEKKEVSNNIKKFDERIKVHKKSPYEYNSVSLEQRRTATASPSASDMAANLTYNLVGKSLGIDTSKEWNQYYDKIYRIVEWAKTHAKTKDTAKLIKFVADLGRRVPTMGARRVDDIYIYTKFNKR